MGKAETLALEFQNLSFAYGDILAIKDVSMNVERGDFVAIVGPNGSGKSTLVKLALGLLRPTNGTSCLLGIDVEKFSNWGAVGYVPQVSHGMHARLPMTVGEIVSHGRYSGFSPFSFWGSTTGADIDDALATVGAEHLRERRIGELSTGQQQRVLVARAIVKKPELLILDEPIEGVDVRGEERLYEVLRELNQEGITIMMVSHDIGAVIREARTVACINQTLVFHGEPHELTRDELARLYGFPVEVLLHDALHEHR
jgi:zinc transport system ATP-binding protein